MLVPAVAGLRREGIDVSGPHPADTLFVRASRGEFDAVVAAYHDQGLIPVKLAAFGHAVNVTIGLPFVRTSVDHGTAFDIVEKGVADPGEPRRGDEGRGHAGRDRSRRGPGGVPLQSPRARRAKPSAVLTEACVRFVLDQVESLGDANRPPTSRARRAWRSRSSRAVARGREEPRDAARPPRARRREVVQRRGARVPGLHTGRRPLCSGPRRPHRLRRQPLRGRGRGGARPRPDRGDRGAMARRRDGVSAAGGGILTSGGSLSNFSAIVTAREARLPEDFCEGTALPHRGHASLRRESRAAGGLPARAPSRAARRRAPPPCPRGPRGGGAARPSERASRPSSSWRAWGRPTPARSTRCGTSSRSPGPTACGSTPTPPTAGSSVSWTAGSA